jgi:hypothetical protein
MIQTQPPVEYLLRCSNPSLEGFELSRLNRIANLRKELADLYEEWIQAEVEARLARWILNTRRQPVPLATALLEAAPPEPRPPKQLKPVLEIAALPAIAKNAS